MSGEDAATVGVVTCTVSVSDLGSYDPAWWYDLTPAEQARGLRFVQDADRRRFALGRYAARRLVAAVAGVDAADVRIELVCPHCGTSDHGKPSALCPAGVVPVSISHSGQKILVAATDGPEVGADIEQADTTRFDPALFGQLAAPAEIARLHQDASTFYRLWTLKEAALKCTGDGLMVAPRSFAIDLLADPPELQASSFQGRTGRLAAPMALRLLEVGPGYAAALAVATRADLRVTWLG